MVAPPPHCKGARSLSYFTTSGHCTNIQSTSGHLCIALFNRQGDHRLRIPVERDFHLHVVVHHLGTPPRCVQEPNLELLRLALQAGAEVEVDLPAGLVRVNPPLDVAQVQQALREEGYEAQPL